MTELQDATAYEADSPTLIPNANNLAIWQSFLLLFSKPKVFFASLPSEDGPKNAIIFLMAMTTVSSLFSTAFNLFVVKHGLPGESPLVVIMVAVIGFFVTAAMIAAQIFLEAGVLKLMALCIKVPVRFQDFLRVIAYSSATACFAWIPYAVYIACLYNLFLLCAGLLKTLRLTIGQVTKLIVVPFFATMLLGVMVSFLHVIK